MTMITPEQVAELVQQYNGTKDIGEASAIVAQIAILSPYKLASLIAQQAKEIEVLRNALEKLAKLGNEPFYGTSTGNVIAQQALNSTKQETE